MGKRGNTRYDYLTEKVLAVNDLKLAFSELTISMSLKQNFLADASSMNSAQLPQTCTLI